MAPAHPPAWDRSFTKLLGASSVGFKGSSPGPGPPIPEWDLPPLTGVPASGEWITWPLAVAPPFVAPRYRVRN